VANPQRPSSGIIEGINVTPLVDILLVLLVIVMVTANLVVAPAVPLDLPATAHSEPIPTDLVVAVPVTGPLLLAGAPVAEDALAAAATEARIRNPRVRAVLQVESNVAHGRVVRVLDRLREAGIRRLAFGVSPAIAEPQPEEHGDRVGVE
jgi:biopolymer transport protein ExbD